MAKSSRSLGLLGMALAIQGVILYEAISVTPPNKNKIREPREFKDEPGVARMIEDYKEIISGTSKKGKNKKIRIKHKIQLWLKEGYINKEDINH